MKTTKTLILLAFLMVSSVFGDTYSDGSPFKSTKEWHDFLSILIEVESSGDLDALGDGGKSYGVLQIGRLYLDDANRVGRTNFDYDRDLRNPRVAMRVTRTYMLHYGRVYTRKTGKPVTAEVYARLHNGGPDGYKKSATDKYWAKVKSVAKSRGINL